MEWMPGPGGVHNFLWINAMCENYHYSSWCWVLCNKALQCLTPQICSYVGSIKILGMKDLTGLCKQLECKEEDLPLLALRMAARTTIRAGAFISELINKGRCRWKTTTANMAKDTAKDAVSKKKRGKIKKSSRVCVSSDCRWLCVSSKPAGVSLRTLAPAVFPKGLCLNQSRRKNLRWVSLLTELCKRGKKNKANLFEIEV